MSSATRYSSRILHDSQMVLEARANIRSRNGDSYDLWEIELDMGEGEMTVKRGGESTFTVDLHNGDAEHIAKGFEQVADLVRLYAAEEERQLAKKGKGWLDGR